MRSFLRQLFPRPVSSAPAPQLGAAQSGAFQIVVPVIRVSDLPRR
ncbi:hypothetical protein [Deinococcus petrolearius]|uniref:Uncharacterized protein n=1 Tax=Deinococcus petrolearius TaxID=1751295 RepID=A0ABW1DNH4_9DEIO